MMSALSRRLIGGIGATLLLVAISAPAMAQAKKYKSLTVRARTASRSPRRTGATRRAPKSCSSTASRKPRSRGSARRRATWRRNSAWSPTTCAATAAPTSRSSRRNTRSPRLGRRGAGDHRRRQAQAAGAGRLVLRRARDRRLSEHPRSRAAGRPQLRQRGVEGRSELLRRRAQGAADDALRRPRHQCRGDARLPAQLLREAADPGRVRGHARLQHDGAAEGARQYGRAHAQHGRDLEGACSCRCW